MPRTIAENPARSSPGGGLARRGSLERVFGAGEERAPGLRISANRRRATERVHDRVAVIFLVEQIVDRAGQRPRPGRPGKFQICERIGRHFLIECVGLIVVIALTRSESFRTARLRCGGLATGWCLRRMALPAV